MRQSGAEEPPQPLRQRIQPLRILLQLALPQLMRLERGRGGLRRPTASAVVAEAERRRLCAENTPGLSSRPSCRWACPARSM